MPDLESLPGEVMLIGYENQENLGLRSMIAVLKKEGHAAVLQPFTPGKQVQILEVVQKYHPRLIGFSLIFQFNLDEFGQLMAYLRGEGVKAHFTVGGHFSTIRPEVVLQSIPQVDTVVRHEGELTIVELLQHLDEPESWANIPGLAFRQSDRTILTQPRPLIADLDDLPWIYRSPPRSSSTGIRTASMLASRGCLFNCSFCSIRQFYGSTPGPLRRVRSPDDVVAEMHELFDIHQVRFFVFQDDDFAARTPEQRRWLAEFLHALDKTSLVGQVGWKIACRVDDLEDDLLQSMIDRGLMCIYLGIEAGNADSLRTLNKHVTVEQNLAAIEMLKRHHLLFSIGFMLFDPSTSIESIRENISFLKRASLDGAYPVNFCKMLPYAGTPIEESLAREGRLKGSLLSPDYDFIDPRLDWYAFLVKRIFHHRNFEQLGLVSLLGTAQFNNILAKKFTPEATHTEYEQALTNFIQKDNAFVLSSLETLLDWVLERDMEAMIADPVTLIEQAECIWQEEAEIQANFSGWLLKYDPELLRIFAVQTIQKEEANCSDTLVAPS